MIIRKSCEDIPHGFAYEFDLMVSDWRKFVPRVIALGASRVVLHVDGWGRSDIDDALSLLSPHKVSLGLCVSNDTNVPAFAALVRSIEREYSRVFIQVMGITRIGIQGQPFDTGVPKRVEYLREACKGIPIQVDGSMNQETMLIVKNRGASCAVVGSSLYRHGDSHEDVKNKYDVLAKSLG